MQQSREYYDILGVKQDATQDEIKKAFRARAKKYHPDHHPGDEEKEAEFKDLSTAYSILSDPEARRHYDETGEAPGGQDTLSMAYGAIVMAFRKIRDIEGDGIFYVDIVARLKSFFIDIESEVESKILGLEKRNKTNSRLMEKLISRAGEKGSFLHASMEQEISQNEKGIREIRQQIEAFKKAQEILKDYKFAVEKKNVTMQDRRYGFPGFSFIDNAEALKNHSRK